MPPRYAYWTILIGSEPTAFRAASQEDLLPTFKRLQLKNSDAKMMWFQNGKLWSSRLEAQDAMRERGERGRSGDPRQSGFRARQKPEWRPKEQQAAGESRESRRSAPREGGRKDSGKLEWKPKGEFTPAAKRSERPEWQPKGPIDRDRKREWKPKGSFERDRKPAWKPKDPFNRDRKPAWKPKGEFAAAPRRPARGPQAGEKLDWKPKGEAAAKISRPRTLEPSGARRDKTWRPGPSTRDEKEARSGLRRDKNWRPGGDHKDPRQKYKDAKKAKWTRFKKNIRTRWEAKQGKKNGK